MKKFINLTTTIITFTLAINIKLIAIEFSYILPIPYTYFEFAKVGDSVYFNNREYFYSADSLYSVNIIGGKRDDSGCNSTIPFTKLVEIS